MAFLEQLEGFFRLYAEYGIVALELIGVTIILFTAGRCVYELICKDQKVKLDLAEGIALALEFKLGGEVLRTTVVRDWSELGVVGAIVALRVIMTFLIHWEIKNEQTHLAEHSMTNNGRGC